MFVRSEVKSKIDSIWNKFWSGGIANPTFKGSITEKNDIPDIIKNYALKELL